MHLELALRLVRVATDPASSATPELMSQGGAVGHSPASASLKRVGNTLAGAFPLRPSGSFEQLLGAIDAAERRRTF
jgi:hypothetical protein